MCIPVGPVYGAPLPSDASQGCIYISPGCCVSCLAHSFAVLVSSYARRSGARPPRALSTNSHLNPQQMHGSEAKESSLYAANLPVAHSAGRVRAFIVLYWTITDHTSWAGGCSRDEGNLPVAQVPARKYLSSPMPGFKFMGYASHLSRSLSPDVHTQTETTDTSVSGGLLAICLGTKLDTIPVFGSCFTLQAAMDGLGFWGDCLRLSGIKSSCFSLWLPSSLQL